MKTSCRFIYTLVLFIFLVAACAPQATVTPTVIDVENAIQVFPTETKQPTIAPTEYPTDTVVEPPVVSSDTPLPTSTNVFAIIGTSLPNKSETINSNNYTHLQKIGQWGRGSIQGVGFTPNGKSFIAISELGWSIYNMDALDQPPQWVGFSEPILFDEFYFSSDGTLVQFVRYDYEETHTYTKNYPYGDVQRNQNGVTWLKPEIDRKYSNITIKAPDGTKFFHSDLVYEYDEAKFSEEKAVREMWDMNKNVLYSLKDDVPYVTYSDRNGPEGCDLSVFSPCGNALMAVATVPDKVLFSSNGETFAALYDPPSLYSGIMRAFSYIRIYNSSNGDLLGSIGGFTKPVQDFEYSPDGKLLVVGYVDGTIVLWDIKSANGIYGSRHMNAPTWRIEYSQDSKFLLIQRDDELEVRLASSGSLVSRYEMAEFAVSPLKNWLAIGDNEGNIEIREIDTGKSVLSIKAHEDRIYSLAFSNNGFYLASSGRDCNIKLWDLETGKLLHYFEETVIDAYEIDSPSRIFSTYLEFIPSKNMLIGFGSWGTVVNWNVNSGATNYVIQSSALEYYNGMVTLKPHFPEYFKVDLETNVFYINENGFNLDTGESLGAYQPPNELPNGCSPVGPISHDGTLMFSRGYDNREGKVCILDTRSFNLLGEIYITPESDNRIAWVDWLYISPDGNQLIVTVGSGIVYIYQIQ